MARAATAKSPPAKGKATAPKAASQSALPKKSANYAASDTKVMKAIAPVLAQTITIKQMAEAYSEKHSTPYKEAVAILTDVFERVVDHLKAGDRVRISGLGIIEVKNRAARMGRNPATGAPLEIKASRKIAFRAAKELKEAI